MALSKIGTHIIEMCVQMAFIKLLFPKQMHVMCVFTLPLLYQLLLTLFQPESYYGEG